MTTINMHGDIWNEAAGGILNGFYQFYTVGRENSLESDIDDFWKTEGLLIWIIPTLPGKVKVKGHAEIRHPVIQSIESAKEEGRTYGKIQLEGKNNPTLKFMVTGGGKLEKGLEWLAESGGTALSESRESLAGQIGGGERKLRF